MTSSGCGIEPREKILARIPIYLRNHTTSSSTCSSNSIGAGSRMELSCTSRSGDSTPGSQAFDNMSPQLGSVAHHTPHVVEEITNQVENQSRDMVENTSRILEASEKPAPQKQAQQPPKAWQSGSMAHVTDIASAPKIPVSTKSASNGCQSNTLCQTAPLQNSENKAGKGTNFDGHNKPIAERVAGIEEQVKGLVGQLAGISGQVAGIGRQVTGFGRRFTEIGDMVKILVVCKEKQTQILYQLSTETDNFDFESSLSSLPATLQDNNRPFVQIGLQDQESTYRSRDMPADGLTALPVKAEEHHGSNGKALVFGPQLPAKLRPSVPRQRGRLHFKTRNLSAALEANRLRTLFGQPDLPASGAALLGKYPDLSADLMSIRTSGMTLLNVTNAYGSNLLGDSDANRNIARGMLATAPARILKVVQDWYLRRSKPRIIEIGSGDDDTFSPPTVQSEEDQREGEAEEHSESSQSDEDKQEGISEESSESDGGNDNEEVDPFDNIYAQTLRKTRWVGYGKF